MGISESIDNLVLIDNGLRHVLFELEQVEPSFFRMAREAHLVLYRAMIEALKGTANLAVTCKMRKDRQCIYLRGNAPWQEIHKVAAAGCSRAWRFSEPAPCAGPQLAPGPMDPLAKAGDRLIGFYDALAMIQADNFMLQFAHSRRASVSDQDMKTLDPNQAHSPAGRPVRGGKGDAERLER